jgi:hypothetical protein
MGDHQGEHSWPIGKEPYVPDGLGKRGVTYGWPIKSGNREASIGSS